MKIAFVHANDWVGMYADGQLVMEGTSIIAYDALSFIVASNAMLDEVTTMFLRKAQRDAIDETGAMPKTLDDIEKLTLPATAERGRAA